MRRRTPPIEIVAAEVCQALRDKGVEAILVGGAVVSIYSANEYQSFDLDFVVRGRDRDILSAMEAIGFHRGKGRHYERHGTPYVVEFLNPPAGIGSAIVQRFATRRTTAGALTLYDPTHSVMDRLAAFFHWSDPQGLEQAVMIARRHRVREREVKRWSLAERHHAAYEEYRSRLREARRVRR